MTSEIRNRSLFLTRADTSRESWHGACAVNMLAFNVGLTLLWALRNHARETYGHKWRVDWRVEWSRNRWRQWPQKVKFVKPKSLRNHIFINVQDRSMVRCDRPFMGNLAVRFSVEINGVELVISNKVINKALLIIHQIQMCKTAVYTLRYQWHSATSTFSTAKIIKRGYYSTAHWHTVDVIVGNITFLLIFPVFDVLVLVSHR